MVAVWEGRAPWSDGQGEAAAAAAVDEAAAEATAAAQEEQGLKRRCLSQPAVHEGAIADGDCLGADLPEGKWICSVTCMRDQD